MMIWLTKEAFGYAYEFVSVQVTAFLYATLIDDHPKFSQKTLVMSTKRCIFAAGLKDKLVPQGQPRRPEISVKMSFSTLFLHFLSISEDLSY